MSRVLVAGVGNIFLSDDGFGCEVARRMTTMRLPEGVTVTDFGIRGIHLAYELLEGYDRLILVDALPRGEAPGTVYVVEPDAVPPGPPDPHGMHPLAVFGYLAAIGGEPVPTLIVGCEPASLDENIGLTEPVERAVDEAIRVVVGLLGEPVAAGSSDRPTGTG